MEELIIGYRGSESVTVAREKGRGRVAAEMVLLVKYILGKHKDQFGTPLDVEEVLNCVSDEDIIFAHTKGISFFSDKRVLMVFPFDEGFNTSFRESEEMQALYLFSLGLSEVFSVINDYSFVCNESLRNWGLGLERFGCFNSRIASLEEKREEAVRPLLNVGINPDSLSIW